MPVRAGLVLGIIAISLAMRLMSLPGIGSGLNFAPMAAIALFGGAFFTSPIAAILVPLAAVWLSDIVVNYFAIGGFVPFYQGFYWQYSAYVLIAGIGLLLRNRVRPLPVLAASLSSSVLFFVVSNFGVWASTNMYPKTFDGLLLCFTMAIPFFPATMLSDLCFIAVMFGGCELLRRREVPAIGRPGALATR